jgi:prepilin-type N-terminal cleavage/methylation domain-containing protein
MKTMRRLGSVNVRQGGFTLIELVMVMAITAVIMAAVTGSIYQVIASNARNSARMIAVKQVESALHFMVRDVQMAQPWLIQTDNLSGGEELKLGWREWDDTVNMVTYSVAGGKLTRQFNSGAQTTVAQFVASLDPVVDADGNITVTITSTTSGRWSASETRTLRIEPRSGG